MTMNEKQKYLMEDKADEIFHFRLFELLTEQNEVENNEVKCADKYLKAIDCRIVSSVWFWGEKRRPRFRSNPVHTFLTT